MNSENPRATTYGGKSTQECAEAEFRFIKNPTILNAHKLAACYQPTLATQLLRPWRVFMTRSFTIEPMIPVLRAYGLISGLDLQIEAGDFNTLWTDLLNPNSPLYQTKADSVIVTTRTADLIPEFWLGFASLDQATVAVKREQFIRRFEDTVAGFRDRSSATLIFPTLDLPAWPTNGMQDSQDVNGQTSTILAINRTLAEIAGRYTGIYLLDYDGIVSRSGRERWYSGSLDKAVAFPLATHAVAPLAELQARMLAVAAGQSKKVLVVDLDNTLWGGVLGEDGPNGIQLADDKTGRPFRQLQQCLLDLYHRGILLAICSKNDESEVLPVLAKHPEMLLRPEHFAAMRINWEDKASNLRSIATELNVGSDSLVFLDDNPAERLQVRLMAPEVKVLEVSEDATSFAKSVLAFAGFDRLRLSEEDRQRTRIYAEQRQRKSLLESATSVEEYLKDLGIVVDPRSLDENDLARVAQLTHKTNQFNLTTRRYTETQIMQIARTPGCRIETYRVSDRFGNSGLVGLVITRDESSICEIDSLLLSCRVVGRGIETAILSRLVEQARTAGCNRLRGVFRPTAKNSMAADVYANHGFDEVERNPEAGILYDFDLHNSNFQSPAWITWSIPDDRKDRASG
jgi:FkbH-like protein